MPIRHAHCIKMSLALSITPFRQHASHPLPPGPSPPPCVPLSNPGSLYHSLYKRHGRSIVLPHATTQHARVATLPSLVALRQRGEQLVHLAVCADDGACFYAGCTVPLQWKGRVCVQCERARSQLSRCGFTYPDACEG